MKYVIAVYLVIVHLLLGIALIKTDLISRIQNKLGFEIQRNELTDHYYTMVAFHQREDRNIPENSILFIGDSMIQGLAVTAISPGAINFGIGGDTTYGMLSRLPLYTSIARSRLIVLAIGVNDLKIRDNESIIKNYKLILGEIPETVPVLCNGVLPVNETASGRQSNNTRIDEINLKIKKLCSAKPQLHYLAPPESLIDAQGNLSGIYHTGDGVHLNYEGNNIWIAALKSAVNNIVDNQRSY